MKTLPKERRYETLSYLPPLTDQQIAKQIDFMIDQGYIPGVEILLLSYTTGLCGNYLYLMLVALKKF
jgi:hypothetical protein